MEQTYAQPVAQPQFVMMPIAQSNGLGVFGFFVALIGLFIPTGIVALLGLVLSLAAIGRAPRGFATCGVMIGLFGTLAWLGLMLVALVVGLVAVVGVAIAGAAGFVLMQPEVVEVTSDMVNVAIAAQDYEQEHDELPADITALAIGVAARIDPWGQPYRFVLCEEEPGFDVVSGGPDGLMDTGDDVRLSGLDRFWESAFESFGENIEEFGQKMERISEHNGETWGQPSWSTYCRAGETYEREARRALHAEASR
jgi:hypothetical protein